MSAVDKRLRPQTNGMSRVHHVRPSMDLKVPKSYFRSTPRNGLTRRTTALRARSDRPTFFYSGNRIRLTNCVNRGSERSPFQRGSRRNQTSQFDLSSKALLSDAKAASF